MAALEAPPQFEPTQSILIPESAANNAAIRGFRAVNEDLPVIFEEMPLEGALEKLEANEVAAVLAGATHTTGDVIKAGITKFNPRRNRSGELDSKGERQLVSSFFLFERHGDDPFIIADCAVNEAPEEHELLQIAEQTVENSKRLDIDPHVAFLSYSTTGSGHGKSPGRVRAVVDRFKEQYPDLPVIGEVQFDAATDERIYHLKTGEGYPGEVPPNVFIAPNLDTGNSIYKVLQSPKFGGGWTAVGPLLQGFEGDHQLHDLSRGVTTEDLKVICGYITKLCGLKEPEEPSVFEPTESLQTDG